MTTMINRFYSKETFIPEKVTYTIDVGWGNDGMPSQPLTEKRTNHEISSWH